MQAGKKTCKQNEQKYVVLSYAPNTQNMKIEAPCLVFTGFVWF